MTILGTGYDWKAARAAREAEFHATFDPKVPGIPGDGHPVILHTDPDRGLTYTWHDRSPDFQDNGPRESGVETSLLTVTDAAGERVGHLRVSFTNAEIMRATFPTPFHWADENSGACFGLTLRDGAQVNRESIWATAHTHLHLRPASMNGKEYRSWALSAADAPTDAAALEAEIEVCAKAYRKQMTGFLRSLRAPFVAFANVEPHLRGTGVGRTMYLLAAQHLGTTGRILVASGNQSAEAARLWVRLQADPTVPTRYTRIKFWRTSKTTRHLALDYTRQRS